MIPYEETKRGWDKAAASNPNAAIHPSGKAGLDHYQQSGGYDALGIVNVLNDLPKDGPFHSRSIIDFGCGNGRVTIPISEFFEKVYAVDFSYAMLQQIPRDEAIQPVLSVDNWFGLGELADYAFSISVFVHNTYESGVKMMKAISMNMKEGGIALLQIPIYDLPKEPTSWTDVGVWEITQFHQAAHLSGFKVLQEYKNEGEFSFSNIGPNHHKFQVLKKVKL